MSIEQMRQVVADLRNTVSWKQKVRYMSDKQVMAIYFSHYGRR